MAKFKVGQRVYEHTEYGFGVVSDIDRNGNVLVLPDSGYPDGVWFGAKDLTALMLAGRPFNVGDRVVIGGEKGKVNENSHQNTLTPVCVFMDLAKEHVYITRDGRAWPGTPIIAEPDWEEESEIGNKEQEKEAFDISPGFAKDWPIDNGIEDVTVSAEEVRHIAEMQDIDELEYRKMPKYIKMALALEGIEVDLKTADLIREIVDSINAHGGQYDLDTSCNIRQQIEAKYV